MLASQFVMVRMSTPKDIAHAGIRTLSAVEGLEDNEMASIKKSALDINNQETLLNESQLQGLLEHSEKLTNNLKTLVSHIRDETLKEPTKDSAKALRKEIIHIMAALEQIEETLFVQLRSVTKVLAKAEEKLEKATQGKKGEITERMKQVRKKLDQAID